MNTKNVSQLALLVICLSLLGGVGSYYFWTYQQNAILADNVLTNPTFGWKYPVTKFPMVGPDPNEIAYSSIRDPGGIPQGLPVRLRIPVIGVNSAIEDALITPDGRMDVPVGSRNVAWFALGPHPGLVGSAVIGGHFGINNGVKFVFYDLDKMKVGDKVYIDDDSGNTLTFQVRDIKLFERDADATTVFTSEDGLAHLNLITCEGIWNQVNDSYPQRRVVFTDSIPTEILTPTGITPPPSQPTFSIDFPRSLTVGSRGADVVSLQTALEQKGLLIMPAGIAKGFFGVVTRVAVAKYQASVGLPAAGYFGPLTRAKLISDVVVVEKPLLPTTAIPAYVSTTSSGNVTGKTTFLQTLIQSVKSLFATPKDGLISAFLVVAIVLMVFKIFRR